MEEKKNDLAKIVLLVLTIYAVIAVVFGTLFHIIGWGFRLGARLRCVRRRIRTLCGTR